jgi:hypothetical protein
MEEKNLKNKWLKWTVILVAILAVTSITLVALLRDRLVSVNQWTVSVNGRGKVTIKPDLAVVALSVQTFKVPSAKTALADNAKKMNQVIGKLKELGIAEEDIKTTGYSITPIYEYIAERSQITGYSASQQLTVKVRQLDNLGNILEQATAAGANQIGGVDFTIEDLEKVKQQARIAALQDARTKAGSLAVASGVRLGKVVGFWENSVVAPDASNAVYEKSAMAYGIGGGAVATPTVSAGQLEIIVDMSVTYKVK